jgi:hypothetical protein
MPGGGEALLALRELVHDAHERLELVLWAYRGTLQLYNSGSFDEGVA